LTAD